MKIQLKRTMKAERCTGGALQILECKEDVPTYFCDTLEPKWRERGTPKVWGKTAIPEGEYEIVFGQSARFHKLMPFLMDVPNFKGVMIHPGNDVADTQGCILVGNVRKLNDGTAFLTDLRKTFIRLYDLLWSAWESGEKIRLRVV